MRYHLTPVRMAIIDKSAINKCWRGCGERALFVYCLLVGMQTGAATVENSINFLKKLKMERPFDPVIPLLGIYPKNPEH